MKIQVSKENIQQVIEHCKNIVIKKEDIKVNKIECGSLLGNIKINYGDNQNIVLNYLNDIIVYYTKENAIKNETSEKIGDKKKFNKPLIQDPNDVQRKIPCPKNGSDNIQELSQSTEEKEESKEEESKEEKIIKKQKKEENEDEEYSEQKIKIFIYGIANVVKESQVLSLELKEFFAKNSKNLNKKEKIDYLQDKMNLCLKAMKSIRYIIKNENIKLDEKSKFIVLQKIGFEYFLLDNDNEKEYIYNFDKKIEGLDKSLRTWSRVKNKAILENKLEPYYQYILANGRKVIENDLCINNIYNIIGHVLINFEEKIDKDKKV